jgi:hypothetical protein
VSDIFSLFTTSALMMEMEQISETLVVSSTLTWLITQEDFSTSKTLFHSKTLSEVCLG